VFQKRFRIGLALSGGGIRGAVHLGILKVLIENGIYPDVISGTSAGSIAGAVYASGLDLDEFATRISEEEVWKLIDPTFTPGYILNFLFYYWAKKPMTMWTIPEGLIKGNKLEQYFDSILEGKCFHQLKVPLYVVSADINTGETVVFCSKDIIPKSGSNNILYVSDVPVSAAVRASISLPGIFVPKRIKKHKLVDGGIKNNVPINVLNYLGTGKILAVDLGVTTGRAKADSFFEILMASVDIMGDELSYYIKKNHPAFFIYPDVKGIGYRDFRKIPELVKYGEEVAQKALPSIVKYLKGY
jgi:NTE family protein